MSSKSSVLRWLLDSDPSIRWQVLRDLTDAPADEVAAERARVASEGAGARLLALQAPDGRWGGAAWNRGWDSTMHVLWLLRELGLDPASPEARRAVGLVRERVTWRGCGPREADDNPFFAGETEPCINGQVAAPGAYFGQDVHGLVERLLGEQLADGGWNCEAPRSARSSFNTTICVLDALLEHERAGGESPAVTAARLRGQEYLLERRLFRRRSTGEVIEQDRKGGAAWTRFAFPTWWHYDVLRALDHLCRAGVAPDERVAEAIDLVASKRDDDGRWPLEAQYPGKMPVETDEGLGRRAGGTPSAPCECWTGIPHAPEADAAGASREARISSGAIMLLGVMILVESRLTMASNEDSSAATFVQREYRPADLAALLDIEKHVGHPPWTRETFRWFLDRKNAAIRVITTAAETRTPIAFYAVEENLDVVYLANLGVAPEWRRKSVATFALTKIVERARQGGFGRVELHVEEENLAAQLLYRKNGFLAVAIARRHYLRKDGRHDGYAMRRELRP